MIRPRATLTGHTGPVHALAWGQLGGRPVLASGGEDFTVRLWDPEREEEPAELIGRIGAVRALAWGQLGGRPVLAVGYVGGEGVGGTVRLWDPERGGEPGKLAGPTGTVYALAWGQLGGRPVLAAGIAGGAVWLWRLGPRITEVHWLTGHRSVYTLAWGQLGGRPVLASGGADGTVQLRDPEHSGKELQRLTGHTGAVYTLAWGQLGGRPVLASGGGEDFTVRLWDPEREEELQRLTGHTGAVFALAWGQLGGRPVLASGGGMVRLWDPERGGEPGKLARPTGAVFALAWGQLGGRPVLASGGGDDGTVRLWDPMIERFTERLPGYTSDDLADPDRLGRDDEAAALAEMITTQSARPPLAIGLFGDWGEGKSHFLSRIAAHVDQLASIARDDPQDRLTHSGIRQVRFNAWHYAETDLWASLVAELFGQMAAAPGDRGQEERRQSRLAAELAARRQLPERLRAAQQRQQKLREELDKQTARQWTLPLRLDPRDQVRLAGLAGAQPEKLYQTMWEAASSIGGTARLAWHICAKAVGRPWFWLCLAFAGAAALTWWFSPLAAWPPGHHRRWARRSPRRGVPIRAQQRQRSEEPGQTDYRPSPAVCR
jgi:hypothetical protein